MLEADRDWWERINAEAHWRCEQWRQEIERQCARRAEIISGDVLRAELEQQTKGELEASLQDRGEQVRRFARNSPKSALVAWMIQDRLATIDADIARLEKLIADNRPDPRWRAR